MGLFIQPKANDNHDMSSQSSHSKAPAAQVPGNGGMVLVAPEIPMTNEDEES